MKNWIVVIAVVFLVGTGIVFLGQKQVDAVNSKGVVILHCELDKASGDIKVKNFDRSNIQSIAGVSNNSSCAAALQKFLGNGYALVSPAAADADSFNYTLSN